MLTSEKQKNRPETWEGHFSLDAPVTGLVFLETSEGASKPALSSGDGTILFLPTLTEEENYNEADHSRLTLPGDVSILCLSHDTDSLTSLTGADDGRLSRIAQNGAVTELAHHKGKWIEHIDAHIKAEIIAYSVGKDVHLLKNDQVFATPFTHPSTVSGLAISPNGKRLAVSHYGGISLWWLNGQPQKPALYEWPGSHLSVFWHPDGGHVLTTMQELSLHGWRLSDGAEMRMQGYGAKVTSISWTPRGKVLFTAGADMAIGWPFTGGGPWNKAPSQIGDASGALVTSVAAHPKDDLLAMGYNDGRIALAPFAASATPLLLLPPTHAPVTALGWSPDGTRLISGNENGQVYDFTLKSVGAAFEAIR